MKKRKVRVCERHDCPCVSGVYRLRCLVCGCPTVAMPERKV